MKDLVDYIVKNIVSNPEVVLITEESAEGQVNLNLNVDPKDMGLVIGKGGQMIKAIRKLLTVRAMAENVRVSLQISEPQVQAAE
ncbi:KH domain-containing protein [Candidatus Daviesbacteria bacterium]|nr:KH domain-containing protein [Candidatus Daviesbacteria bacterium]